MSEKKITSVLNVSLSCARPDHLDDQHFKRIAVKDNYQENISPHLDEAIQFIELARQNDERVLVHCVAGVSRSATVAIAYVMHYLRLPFEDAYRFVKEKRPTISPNFNFLGQLIEFEKVLRERGRVTANKTTSPAKTATSSSMTCATIKVTKLEQQTKVAAVPVSQQQQQQRSVVTKFEDVQMPKSSFCRRRKGPSLSARPSYIYTPTDGFLDNGPRGAGVILDLHVSVPANGSSGEQSLRRLGSDGVEDDNEGSQDEFQSSFVMPVTSPFHQSVPSPQQKSNSFPRSFSKQGAGCSTAGSSVGARMTCTSMFRNRVQMQRNFGPLMLTADTSSERGSHFNIVTSDHSRPATAPNTPSLLVFAGSSSNQTSCSESAQDVEMTSSESDDANQRPSPPSPVLRDSCRTDPTSFYVSYEAAETSTNMRFISRKTRSPKIMKKTFNPNLQRPYGLNFRQTSSRHHRQFEGTWNLQLQKTQQQQQCESPSTDRLSNLTLSSPVKNPDEPPPLEVIGSRLTTPHVDTPHPAGGASAVSSPNTRRIPNRNSSTGEPFKLCTGNELKPRWRNRNSSGPATSGGSSSATAASKTSESGETITASSSQQSLNHCNLEIVGLS